MYKFIPETDQYWLHGVRLKEENFFVNTIPQPLMFVDLHLY